MKRDRNPEYRNPVRHAQSILNTPDTIRYQCYDQTSLNTASRLSYIPIAQTVAKNIQKILTAQTLQKQYIIP